MNKNTKVISLAAAVTAVIATVGIATTTFAYRGDFDEKDLPVASERQAQMTKAFASGDYATWKSLVPANSRALEKVTPENFAKFSQMHDLMLAGKYDEAQAIRQELGMGQRRGGQGKAFGQSGKWPGHPAGCPMLSGSENQNILPKN